MLADAGAMFVGQGVEYDGVATYDDLEGVPKSQRTEFPVAEELQLGYCTGLAMQGVLPVSIFPRMDFLMRAMDQLVNHLDKIPDMSRGQWRPKVIIRTRVGTRQPLDAGPQHTNDHTVALRLMLRNVKVWTIQDPREILPTYLDALESKNSVVVVECC